ncbi:hypothetical protein ABH930_007111 [Kitasatospora sp. GAS204A]|uniref:hypothetical protein n=1 Tax=unclassified Kitasatospora TaxID=2633591 RepID=UPI0024768C00|nr:hypothetical protein [Kitasatospora sp. GAS204B]MDH6122827.1 hypothetical protein [Kitasatospora sp. GAS204B]
MLRTWHHDVLPRVEDAVECGIHQPGGIIEFTPLQRGLLTGRGGQPADWFGS